MILRYEPKFPVLWLKLPANYSIIITHYLSIISIVTWLWAGQSGVRIQAIAVYFLFSTTVQTSTCTNPASCSRGTIFYCWGVRSPGRDICHSLPSSAAVRMSGSVLLQFINCDLCPSCMTSQRGQDQLYLFLTIVFNKLFFASNCCYSIHELLHGYNQR